MNRQRRKAPTALERVGIDYEKEQAQLRAETGMQQHAAVAFGMNRNSDAFTKTCALSGPIGVSGPVGPQGPTGDAGTKGAVGERKEIRDDAYRADPLQAQMAKLQLMMGQTGPKAEQATYMSAADIQRGMQKR